MRDVTEYFLRGKVPDITESESFKRMKQKAESVQQAQAEAPKKQGELFPKPWSDAHAIGANTLVRSAIFGTFDRQAVFSKDAVFTYENAVSLKVQGEALNQTDYDVFQILLVASSACEIEAGSKFCFTRYSLMKVLGWPTAGVNYQRLDDSLTRLASFVLDLKIEPCKTYPKGWRFNGSLIQLGRDNLNTLDSMKNSMVRVNMHEELMGFFMQGTYHMENLEQRKALGKNQLAKALHAFYSSHLNPMPITLETLQGVLGVEQLPKHFKQALKRALTALEAVGFIQQWDFLKSPKGDCLHVVRAFTKEEKKLMKPAKGKGNSAWQTSRLVADEVADYIYTQKQGLEILHESIQDIIKKP